MAPVDGDTGVTGSFGALVQRVLSGITGIRSTSIAFLADQAAWVTAGRPRRLSDGTD